MFIIKCRDLALRGQQIDVRGQLYTVDADATVEVENEEHAAILLQMQSFYMDRIRPAKVEFHPPTVEVISVENELIETPKSETIVDQKPARRRGR
jgi:hypothetical protein